MARQTKKPAKTESKMSEIIIGAVADLIVGLVLIAVEHIVNG